MEDRGGKSIHSFVGEFKIRNGSGVGVVQTGDSLYIGTGRHFAPPIDGDRVGVAVWAEDGTRRFPAIDEPAYFHFRGDRLEFESRSLDGVEMRIVLSLFQIRRDDGSLYRAPYGLVVIGDPDQVGAWGADDNPDDPSPIRWG